MARQGEKISYVTKVIYWNVILTEITFDLISNSSESELLIQVNDASNCRVGSYLIHNKKCAMTRPFKGIQG